MNSKVVDSLKWARLFIAVLILLFTPYNIYMEKINIILPDQLIMTGLIAFFVFFLGLEYHIMKKQKKLAYFLMLFAIIMFISVILGLMYT